MPVIIRLVNMSKRSTLPENFNGHDVHIQSDGVEEAMHIC